MRIASLVPSATEMLFALGLGDQVVAVTHECDFPPEAGERAHLTRSVIPTSTAASTMPATTKTAAGSTAGSTAGQIDAAVRETVGAGRHLYKLDEETLAGLDVDLIATQAVCDVCAVSYEDVRAVAARLPTRPAVISLDPVGLDDVLTDVSRLGEAAEADAAASALRAELEARLTDVRAAVEDEARPRVLALEWLDPPFIGGHWIPEMIEAAGGADPIGVAGAKSRTAEWDELAAVRPDVVVAMPCGWDAARARSEALQHWDRLEALGADRVIAVDAAAAFSRPGPRLVEGTELLAHLLHPNRVEPPPGVGFERVRQRQVARD